MATLDRSLRHAGVTAFLVDPAQTKGIRIRELDMRTLRRDNLAEVSFEESFVPDDAVLGGEKRGFPILGGALDMGRYSVAARCVGQAQRCIDLALPYARDRKAFGQPIGGFQLIQQKLSEMICRTEQARLLVYRLGRMKDAGHARTSLEAWLRGTARAASAIPRSRNSCDSRVSETKRQSRHDASSHPGVASWPWHGSRPGPQPGLYSRLSCAKLPDHDDAAREAEAFRPNRRPLAIMVARKLPARGALPRRPIPAGSLPRQRFAGSVLALRGLHARG